MYFSRKIFELFKLAGWHPGRKIDCTGNIEFLKDRGFVVNDLIVEFLKEFSQLEFDIANPFEDIRIDKHHTFVKRTVGNLKVNDFEYFQRIFGEKIVPVGELFNRHLYIFFSESGNIYTELGLLGKNFMEAFENIFSRKIQKSYIASELNSKEYNSGVICIVTDKTQPDIIYNQEHFIDEYEFENEKKIKFIGYGGLYLNNPSIIPNKIFENSSEYRNYHKFCITDGGIDRILKEEPKILRDKDVNRIRNEMANLRMGIYRVIDEAKSKKAFAFDGSQSFEIWPIENCAEIWAARNAILNEIRFENIAFSLIRKNDKTIMDLCNNCRRIFESNYRVKNL